MIQHEDENGHKYFNSLEDVSPEYHPIKVYGAKDDKQGRGMLQFYTLRKKTTTICKANIEVIRYLQYVVKGSDNRYYMKLFRAYSLDDFYGYQSTDIEVENLRRCVADGTCTLLLTKQQVQDTTDLLTRLWKANLQGEGKVHYPIYLELVEMILKAEDYKENCKNLPGYKTACNIFKQNIMDLWVKAANYKKQVPLQNETKE